MRNTNDLRNISTTTVNKPRSTEFNMNGKALISR